MTEQLKYDNAAILPVLKNMLEQEATQTDKLSNKLITIGELAVASSLTLKDTQTSTKEGNEKLGELAKQQESILDNLTRLNTAMDHVKTGDHLTEELREDFRKQLGKVIENHSSDKDSILEHISKVYADYTEKVVGLSNAIMTLNETLTNPEYKNRVETLLGELKDVKESVDGLKEAQEQNTREQLKQMEELIKQLTLVDDSFGKFANTAESNQGIVTQVVQHVNIIEDRLDALLATNSTTGDEINNLVGGIK